jgi:hypothetical protein
MIDTKELRQLAQAATPGPWKTGQYLGSLRQFVIHTDVGDKGRGSDVAFTSSAFGSDETVANARLISAANPSVISELLDRLEAAEKERDALRLAVRHEADCVDAAKAEIEALRARIEAMEQQEPVAWLHESRRDSDVVTSAVKHVWGKVAVGSLAAYSIPLYLAPGAQPAPSAPDVDALAQFIRKVDGAHQLGAAMLAERIADWLAASLEAKP